MRKWNDKGPQEMQELTKATLLFLGTVNVFTVMAIISTGQVSWMQIVGIISSVIMIYLMMSGNLYKILRWYAEYRLKKRDNKWR